MSISFCKLFSCPKGKQQIKNVTNEDTRVIKSNAIALYYYWIYKNFIFLTLSGNDTLHLSEFFK